MSVNTVVATNLLYLLLSITLHYINRYLLFETLDSLPAGTPKRRRRLMRKVSFKAME